MSEALEDTVTSSDETTTLDESLTDDTSVDTSSADDATSSDEVSTTEAEQPPAVFDWNGEVDSLRKSEWFDKIDEQVRDAILKGVEAKYRNFERGYTKAFQDAASKRRELESRATELKEQELRLQRWLTGDANPMEDKQREIDSMRQAHETALAQAKAELEEAVKRAEEGWTGKYSTVEQEREALRQKVEQFETQMREAEEREIEAAIDDVETWLKSDAPDVYDNDAAFDAFCKVCASGVDPEDAVVMVRAKYGPPPAPVAEELPADLKAANLGASRAGNTVASENRSYKDIMDAMRRAAQTESYTEFMGRE